MSTPDGGPAFPRVFQYTGHDEEGGTATISEEHPGMSLRDWFAGQALCGVLSNPRIDFNKEKDIAKGAFEHADAMLKERER